MKGVERNPDWPDHWGAMTLGEASTVVTSGSRDWKPYYGRGRGVFILTQNVRMRRLDLADPFYVDPPDDDPSRVRSAVQRNDLLINIVGDVGAVARVADDLPDHFVCQSVALVRPALPEISRFLELYLAAPDGGQAYFARRVYGVGRGHLSFADLKATPIPVPPLAEASAIVDEVTALLDEVSEAAALLTVTRQRLVEQYESAVLRDAFTGRLTHGEADGLPTRWRVVALGDVATVATGTTPSMKHPEYYGGGAVPFVRPSLLSGDRISATSESLSDLGVEKARTVPASSVLMQCLGFGLGKVGMATERVAFNQQIHASTFGDEVDPEYGLLYLRSMGEWVRQNATITLTPLLNKTKFKQMPFVLPPREDQGRIVEQVRAAFRSAVELRASLAANEQLATSLQRAILRNAMSGRFAAGRPVQSGESVVSAIGEMRSAAMAASREAKKRRAVASAR